MNYIKILNKHGIDYATLDKNLTGYVNSVTLSERNESKNHSIDLGNQVTIRLSLKINPSKRRKKTADKRDAMEVMPLSELFDVAFYQGTNPIELNPQDFFVDFKSTLRSLATVYIVGNNLAFPFDEVGSKVKALLASDFVESLLSGVEGTTLSSGNIGDANIPLQSIADNFAVIKKHIIDQAERTGSAEVLSDIPQDCSNVDNNYTYQVKASTTGKPAGEESTEGVLQTYKLNSGGFFQIFLPVRTSSSSTSPLLYIRTTSNAVVTAWRPILTKESIENLIAPNLTALETKITDLATKTRPVYDVFLEEDTSNGTAINSAESFSPCYVGGGRIVYVNRGAGYKLYIKSINDTSNGTPINSVHSVRPCYVGGGRIVYTQYSVLELYLKSINDTSKGTAINSSASYSPCYVGDGRIVYQNVSDGYKLYLKSINDTSNGTLITSRLSYSPCYVGGGQIVYSNGGDGKLYIKSINDTAAGTPINSVRSETPCYVGDGRIVYQNGSDGNKLYLKSINDTSDGTAINSAESFSPCYVGGGRIIYRNEDDNRKLYIKNIDTYY